MELLRQYLQRLAQQSDLFYLDGDLAGVGAEYLTTDTYDITNVHLLECCIGYFTQSISGDIDLYVTLQICHVTKGSLTHNTLGHHTTGDYYFLTFILFKIFLHIRSVSSHIKASDLERVIALCLQVGQLFATNLQKLI